MQVHLDFLQFESRLRRTRKEGKEYIFDPIRKKHLVLTPEELLRQLVLLYLMEERMYPSSRIRSEQRVVINDMPKRCDILVYDRELKPWLLIECKSPKVRLTQETFDQAAVYNLRLQVPYMAITNGLNTYISTLDHEQKTFNYLPDFPPYPPVQTPY
jgi:hypothetical protein